MTSGVQPFSMLSNDEVTVANFGASAVKLEGDETAERIIDTEIAEDVDPDRPKLQTRNI